MAFAEGMVELSHCRPQYFRVKPKLHMFVELCEGEVAPRGAGRTEMKTLEAHLQRWGRGVEGRAAPKPCPLEF